MKRFRWVFRIALVLACCTGAPVFAQYANHVGLIDNKAAIEEVTNLRISINSKTLTGFVEVPVCHFRCEKTRLAITPATIASEKGVRVPLERAKYRYGKSVGIVYDVEKKEVTNISW